MCREAAATGYRAQGLNQKSNSQVNPGQPAPDEMDDIQPTGCRKNDIAACSARRDILRCMDRLFTPWRYAYITSKPEHPLKKGVPEKLAGWPGDLHCVFCNM